MSVLRRAYVEVEPDVSGFDDKLREKFSKTDPGGKAGRQLGGQLNRALKKLDLDAVDVKADPKKALAAIGETERKLQALSRNASTIEIKVRAEQGLKEISRFRKTLGDVGEDAAPEFTNSFMRRLGPLLAKLPVASPLAAGLGAAAASAAPLLGAAVAGGIIGGVGIGGVVGGITLAAKDERVQAAAKGLGDRLEKRLFKAGGAFVRPAIEGLQQVQRAADEIDFEGILGKSAQFVQPLTGGVASALTDIGGALKKLVDNAAAPISAISNGIALIGKNAAIGLSSLSDNAEGSAKALRDVFSIIGYGITTTFQLVNILTELYEINKAISGDAALQVLLKATGAQMDNNTFSARRTAEATTALDGTMIQAAVSAEELKKRQEALKVVQDRVTASQTALGATLDTLGGKNGIAARTSDALRTAMDNLYGATIRQTDANQAFEASWDELSGAIKGNKGSLDIHTAAGRANRDALKGLIGTTNEAYIADINAGVAIDEAKRKHDNRIKSIEKESVKLGLNAGKTHDLIETYGQIPPNKTTDLVLDGVREVVRALQNLYIYQRALAEGRSIASIEQKMRTGSDSGPAKPGGGFADGGQIGGWSPNSRADNIPAMLTAKEWVHPVDAVDYYGPRIMGAIQKRQVPREVLSGFATGQLGKMGDLPFFARGGQVAPIDRSRSWKFAADMGGTRIPSKKEAASKVFAGGGAGGAFVRAQNGKPYVWASAGPGGYDCSGIVSAVYNVLHGRSPYSHTFSTGSLPGKWFTKPGVGGQLTAAWSHPGQSPASSTTGHMMGMVGGLTFESSGSRGVHLGSSTRRLTDFANIAHYAQGGQVAGHKAMDDGGFRTLLPGLNLVPNGTGRPEPIAGPAAMAAIAGGGDTIHLHFHGPVASKQAAEDMVVAGYLSAKTKKRLP